jgi:hypothetical protein
MQLKTRMHPSLRWHNLNRVHEASHEATQGPCLDSFLFIQISLCTERRFDDGDERFLRNVDTYCHVHDYRRGLDWCMDLLATYTPASELQAVTAQPLISTVAVKPLPACCVFTSRSLTTASNSGDSSASRAQVLP